jgi:hypothetical protein
MAISQGQSSDTANTCHWTIKNTQRLKNMLYFEKFLFQELCLMPQLDCKICRCPIIVPSAGERAICPYCNSSYVVEQEGKALGLKLLQFAGLGSPDEYSGVPEFIATPAEVLSAEKNPVPVSPEEIPPPAEEKETAAEAAPQKDEGKIQIVSAVETTDKKAEPDTSKAATAPQETVTPAVTGVSAKKQEATVAPPKPPVAKDLRSPQERILAEEEEELARQGAFLKQFRAKAGRSKIPAILLLCLAGVMVLCAGAGVAMLLSGGYDEDTFNYCFALPAIILLISLAFGIFFLIRYLVKRPLLRTLQKLLKEQEAKVRDLKAAKES